MKMGSPALGVRHRRQAVDGRLRGVLWLLAGALAGMGGSACSSWLTGRGGPPNLICPQPRQEIGCIPGKGVPPKARDCTIYHKNSSWLPPAYVINATCICEATINDPTADCVRAKIEAQTAAMPDTVREKGRLCNSKNGLERDQCIEENLKPIIYQVHLNAYTECCCPCGPPGLATWDAVTVIASKDCKVSADLFDIFGSCQGTPGQW